MLHDKRPTVDPSICGKSSRARHLAETCHTLHVVDVHIYIYVLLVTSNKKRADERRVFSQVPCQSGFKIISISLGTMAEESSCDQFSQKFRFGSANTFFAWQTPRQPQTPSTTHTQNRCNRVKRTKTCRIRRKIFK